MVNDRAYFKDLTEVLSVTKNKRLKFDENKYKVGDLIVIEFFDLDQNISSTMSSIRQICMKKYTCVITKNCGCGFYNIYNFSSKKHYPIDFCSQEQFISFI